MTRILFPLLICTFTLTLFLPTQSVLAEDMLGMGVGGKVSSLGVGGEVVGRVIDNINLRAGIQGIAYDYNDTYSGIEYEAELELFSTMLLADLFPLDNNFRISGGMMFNQNELTVSGRPTDNTFEIGGITYPSSQVGSLSGTIDFNSTAPYLGLGYGGSFNDTSNFSFFMDIGILFQGSPNVSYTATGPLANDPAFQANLEQERKELEEDLDEYEYYPVISMGVMFKF